MNHVSRGVTTTLRNGNAPTSISDTGSQTLCLASVYVDDTFIPVIPRVQIHARMNSRCNTSIHRAFGDTFVSKKERDRFVRNE